jgi:hypothetical protein
MTIDPASFRVRAAAFYVGCAAQQQSLVTTAGPHGETHLEGEAVLKYRADKQECADQGKAAESDRMTEVTADCMRSRGCTVTVDQ